MGQDLELQEKEFIKLRVEKYFAGDNLNCVQTTLKIMAERFSFQVHPQLIGAAIGLNGAGKYGAQCGLVEGGLMFLAVMADSAGFSKDRIEQICREYAAGFEKQFGSLLCSILRPEGFKPENPPNICQPLAEKVIEFDINFMLELLGQKRYGAGFENFRSMV